MMKHIILGILAHVDAGKTTLSEAMLYQSGSIRKLGRVDHKNAFLDHNSLERERGITIFSKQARILLADTEFTLVDTPGHTDFAAEAERTLPVLDYAVLVISSPAGIQAHTETLWKLLRQYKIPTFLFLNKTDLPGPDRKVLLNLLKQRLSPGCIDFSGDPAELHEEAALCQEEALDEFIRQGSLSADTLAGMIRKQQIFPCYFGAALRLEGVAAFLEGLERYTREPSYPEAFSALVYQINRDSQGLRLTHMKITGGVLHTRSSLSYTVRDGSVLTEKIKELRLYSGARFTSVEKAPAGTVCTAAGLSGTYPGQLLGSAGCAPPPLLEPVMTYAVHPPTNCDPMQLYPKLKLLEEEDPTLHLEWDSVQKEIHGRFMGKIQIEILKQLMLDRFGLNITVDAGRILYKETIAGAVEGVGHYEPLRHYAEVHLLLEPMPPGTGLLFESKCSEDVLDRNWQRLILTHLTEKTHLGVLTGSPITDIKITLMSGRAHLKHTEGGDFRQATYRAVRQGLMQAQSILLEPQYHFRLSVSQEQAGRAIHDLRAMSAAFEQQQEERASVFTGTVAVEAFSDYAAEVSIYTRGMGHVSCEPGGYAPCREPERILAAKGYQPEADLDNTPDSVFCAHGAGFTVKWNQVPEYMHLDSCLKKPEFSVPELQRQNLDLDQKELEAIMDREFGPIRRPIYGTARKHPAVQAPPVPEHRAEYLIVDGYNIIFAWDELSRLAGTDLSAARQELLEILCNYAGFRKRQIIVVFDGYRVRGSRGAHFMYHGIAVVYTRERETGDAYIEALTHRIGKNDRVLVATSDSLVQLSALRSGVLRMSARELKADVENAGLEITALLKNLEISHRLQALANQRENLPEPLKRLLEEQSGSDCTPEKSTS